MGSGRVAGAGSVRAGRCKTRRSWAGFAIAVGTFVELESFCLILFLPGKSPVTLLVAIGVVGLTGVAVAFRRRGALAAFVVAKGASTGRVAAGRLVAVAAVGFALFGAVAASFKSTSAGHCFP